MYDTMQMPRKFIKSEGKIHVKGTGFHEVSVSVVQCHLIPTERLGELRACTIEEGRKAPDDGMMSASKDNDFNHKGS